MNKAALIILMLACSGAFAQTGSQFEVASLKVDQGPFIGGVSGRYGGGPGSSDPIRFTARQVALKLLVMMAWDKGADQVSGLDFLDDRVTIAATIAPGATKEQFLKMLQNLLVERFHLTFHTETRAVPGYEMVVAPGGFKLKPWVAEDNVVPGKPVSGVDADGFPRLGPGRGMAAFSFSRSGGGMDRSVRRQTLQAFANSLGRSINASNGVPPEEKTPRVANKTNITGIYEIKLGFVSRVATPGLAPPSSPGDNPLTAEDPGGPDIFTALQTDLGLKLVKVKNVPIDVMVIDHVDKTPVEN